MSTPLISEIMPWPGVYAPRSWAFCQGQLLAISTNDALFSLIGTIYGGDGRTTFALPDMRGRMSIGAGTGPGLSPYPLGARFGTETVTLNLLELPVHNHSAQTQSPPTPIVAGVDGSGNQDSPDRHKVAKAGFSSGPSSTAVQMYSDSAPDTTVGGLESLPFGSITLFNAGASESHENRMPFQVINFCIALYGIYPSRS